MNSNNGGKKHIQPTRLHLTHWTNQLVSPQQRSSISLHLEQKCPDVFPPVQQRLPSFKNWRTFNIGTTEENKKKNRSSSVIPCELTRISRAETRVPFGCPDDHLCPSDDYNRVLLKLDEGHSHESDPDDDYEMSSEEDNEDAAMYINASLISVRPWAVQRCGLVGLVLRSCCCYGIK